MKKDFSTEIEMDKTDPLVLRQQEQANIAALGQATQQLDNQQKQIKMAILQTQKIQALKEKLVQQIGNSATSVGGGSIPGQISALSDTSGSSIKRENNAGNVCTIPKEPTTKYNMYGDYQKERRKAV